MEEYLSLEVLIMMLLMSFIENRSVNKNEKENKDEAIGLDVLPQSLLSPSPFPLTFPDLSSPLPSFISSSLFPLLSSLLALYLFFLLSPLLTLYLFPLLACLTSPFSSPLARLFTSLFRLSIKRLTCTLCTRANLSFFNSSIIRRTTSCYWH